MKLNFSFETLKDLVQKGDNEGFSRLVSSAQRALGDLRLWTRTADQEVSLKIASSLEQAMSDIGGFVQVANDPQIPRFCAEVVLQLADEMVELHRCAMERFISTKL